MTVTSRRHVDADLRAFIRAMINNPDATVHVSNTSVTSEFVGPPPDNTKWKIEFELYWYATDVWQVVTPKQFTATPKFGPPNNGNLDFLNHSRQFDHIQKGTLL